MGEVADMIIDGILCAGCGVYLGEEVGFPCYCESCREGEDQDVYPAHPYEKDGE